MNSNYRNSGVRKTHYDSKGAIALEIPHETQVGSEAMSMGKAYNDDMSIGMEADLEYTDAFEMTDDEVFDHGEDFTMGLSSETFVMAKAYDTDDLNSDELHDTSTSHARAMNDAYDSEPLDENNQYSDVFESSDDAIFTESENASSNAPQVDAMADEVEVDDQFAKDLQAVLSGQKSLANLADYSEGQQVAPAQNNPPADDTDERVKELEKKMAKDEAIFDQLAADRNNLTTYQLGEVELNSIFDEADGDLTKGSVALAKDRVEDIIDERSVAMDGMEYAEDFEVMDSIAEDELAESKKTTSTADSHSDIKDAVIEEEIIVKSEDNTATEE
ncbi:MAG: hypothetical protein ACFHU9_03980 [Fluviicola sp.]